MKRTGSLVAIAAVVPFLVTGMAGCTRKTLEPSDLQAERQAIFEAEDARAPDVATTQVLIDGTQNANPGIQRMAVRALGRLERPDVVSHIAPLAAAPDAGVRAEAVNALGQAVASIRPGTAGEGSGGPSPRDVATLLLARLEVERNPEVRGVIGRTLGRLPCADPEDARRAEDALVAISGSAGSASDAAALPALLGAARGFESLFRRTVKFRSAGTDTVARVRAMALDRAAPSPGPALSEAAAGVRRLALAALNAASQLDEATVRVALADPDDQVRRLAVAGLMSVPGLAAAGRQAFVSAALTDPAAAVRYEALRVQGRSLPASGWEPILAAVADPSAHVALLAIDLLGRSEAGPDAIRLLTELAGASRGAGTGSVAATAGLDASVPVLKAWHGPAHALVALAKASPDAARPLLPGFAGSPAWPVRMYAARAAGTSGDDPTLERLLQDPHDNVRNAALSEVVAVRQHDADPLAIAALERPDYQLVMTAARALRGSPNGATALPALLAALARITAEKRDTSRDPRMALLDRIADFGAPATAPSLLPYTRDFDPRVADRAAAIIGAWTGERPADSPQALPLDTPRVADVERLRAATVRVTMAGLGAFDLQLLPDAATATVARFVRLVEAGHYNGLTFHRVVPNFIIQGGSPGANEYMGDGAYLRDELGLDSHARGTVGISTRGRDTGDAQIFLNLVDNARLDHDFTVFALVVSGMDIVDRILECDVIERMEIVKD